MTLGVPRRLAVFVCLCGLFCGAQTGGLWLDVPFVKQEKDGCGAASIAMVMQYWQKQAGGDLQGSSTPAPAKGGRAGDPGSSTPPPATPARAGDPSSDASLIQRALYSPKAHGIYASDMERYFQQHGFKTFVFTGTWDDLRQHLEKGRPLIAALKPSPGESVRHYVVVVGLDSKQNLVLVNDAAQRKLLKEDRGSFEKEWAAVGRWTLLAVPQNPAASH